ncbi:unnamed protein product, partial [Urochloa humidicola]
GGRGEELVPNLVAACRGDAGATRRGAAAMGHDLPVRCALEVSPSEVRAAHGLLVSGTPEPKSSRGCAWLRSSNRRAGGLATKQPAPARHTAVAAAKVAVHSCKKQNMFGYKVALAKDMVLLALFYLPTMA